LKTKLGAGDAYTKVLNYTAPSCPGTYTVTLTAVASAGSNTSSPSSTSVTLNVQ
jgi:PKD repeat protein